VKEEIKIVKAFLDRNLYGILYWFGIALLTYQDGAAVAVGKMIIIALNLLGLIAYSLILFHPECVTSSCIITNDGKFLIGKLVYYYVETSLFLIILFIMNYTGLSILLLLMMALSVPSLSSLSSYRRKKHGPSNL